jgi:hypothetical protein
LHRCNVFDVVDSIILFSFSCSPKFHRIVPLLSFLYINVYMFLFVYTLIFWIYLPHMRKNMQALPFWTWLTYHLVCFLQYAISIQVSSTYFHILIASFNSWIIVRWIHVPQSWQTFT